MPVLHALERNSTHDVCFILKCCQLIKGCGPPCSLTHPETLRQRWPGPPVSPSLATLLPCVWPMFVHQLFVQVPTLLLNHRRKLSNSSGVSRFGVPVFYTICVHWNHTWDKRVLSNVFSEPIIAHFPRLRTDACEQAERVRSGRKRQGGSANPLRGKGPEHPSELAAHSMHFLKGLVSSKLPFSPVSTAGSSFHSRRKPRRNHWLPVSMRSMASFFYSFVLSWNFTRSRNKRVLEMIKHLFFFSILLKCSWFTVLC